MRTVEVRPPSFPTVTSNAPIDPRPAEQWQVLCGDADHWRVGIFSPTETRPDDLVELELHDCPELFLLIEGRVTLLVAERGKLRELPLERGRPVLITAPHGGFCPDGPHRGAAFVVERDALRTEYRGADEWAARSRSSQAAPWYPSRR